jgi:hypothetical protein
MWLPLASAGDLFKDLGKAVKQVHLDKVVQELKTNPNKVAQDAVKSTDSALKHVDSKDVDKALSDTGRTVLQAVPGATGLDAARMKALEDVIEKAGPGLLKQLSEADPAKVEQVLKTTDPDKLIEMVNELNRAQPYVIHWRVFLICAMAALTLLYLAAQLVKRMWRRRPKIWSNWTPQIKADVQLSMWVSGPSCSNDAEEHLINDGEGSPSTFAV